jgi:hypothetical protein
VEEWAGERVPAKAPAIRTLKAAEDKAFNDALKNIPAPNKPYDPRGGIRDTPKK